jgi:hypothetical protein
MRNKVVTLLVSFLSIGLSSSLIPFLDGGSDMPKLYNSYFDDQIAKQASTAVGKAVAAGIQRMEVNFPPVPNLDEVRFGTPLNKKFGTNVVAKTIRFPGGYKPGSELSRQLVAYSNMHWAKQIAPALGGGVLGGNAVTVLTAEPVDFALVQNSGVGRIGPLNARASNGISNKAVILINPGGEEQWERMRSVHGSNDPLLILNNSYSTTYDLGNKRGYEEAYYLKRISKGWVFRAYPGDWKAYLEKPDGTVELLKSYKTKPSLKEVATLVREESFRRYAINNDRWTPGFGERL